jgi:hypothetical protein
VHRGDDASSAAHHPEVSLLCVILRYEAAGRASKDEAAQLPKWMKLCPVLVVIDFIPK